MAITTTASRVIWMTMSMSRAARRLGNWAQGTSSTTASPVTTSVTRFLRLIRDLARYRPKATHRRQ